MPAIIPAVGLIISAYGANQAHEAGNAQRIANEGAAAEGKKAQSEQVAVNAQRQADEKRKLIREERVRRASILQASSSGGTAGGSGEVGATSSLGTQLNTSLGVNAGLGQAGAAISGYQQNAANFNLAAQNASLKAQDGQGMQNIGMSIFSAGGGIKAIKGAFGK